MVAPFLRISMRKLVLEYIMKELSEYRENPLYLNLKTFEIVYVVRPPPSPISFICKVELKDPASNVHDIFRRDFDKVEVLDHDRTVFTCFLRRRAKLSGGIPIVGDEGSLIGTELRDGKTTVTWLGTPKQVKTVLKRLTGSGLHFRVVSNSDADLPLYSPLSSLTEKQRRVLVTAHNLGYFEIPKRINSEELASKLNMRSSTFITHRIKAEQRLLGEIIQKSQLLRDQDLDREIR
jgi:predicted DNA binding protein